jgi:NADPH:quinone reductase-like Zn-dependent oxidoreductase
MQAIVYQRYGSPDVLSLEEVAKPTLNDGEVLVAVRAASINTWDGGLVTGKSFLARMSGGGGFRPKHRVPGGDVAGVVEAEGAKVTRFKAGDEVFGDLASAGWGSFAEYACAPEGALVQKPAAMTFSQAATLAMQGVKYDRSIRPGDQVLINGAGGGTGTFALQMVKSAGAEVTGVDSAAKLDRMGAVGADRVIDYVEQDFTQNGLRYDRILDFEAHHSMFDYRRALAPGGVYAMVGGTTSRIIQAMALGPLLSRAGSRKIRVVMYKPGRGLPELVEFMAAGNVTPVIDSSYSLAKAPEAFRRFGGGQFVGKILITI